MVFKRISLLLLLLLMNFTEASDIHNLCAVTKGQKPRLSNEVLDQILTKIFSNSNIQTSLFSACNIIKLKYKLGPIHFYETSKEDTLFYLHKDNMKGIRDVGVIEEMPKFSLRQIEIKSQEIGLTTYALTPLENNLGTTILIRTPYFLSSSGKSLSSIMTYLNFGYNVVLQPIRGSHLSEGEFDWLNWQEERDDAKVTLDWIVKNSWSNGDVILEGVSYPGFTALAAAATNHSAIIGVLAASAPTNKKLHSLSAGNNFFSVANYLLKINGSGDLNKNLYDSIFNLYKEKGEDILNNFEKKFGSNNLKGIRALAKDIQENNYSSDNKELFSTLKEVVFPIVHSYGVKNDQDSLDSHQNYEILQEKKNNYLYIHNEGHSGVINDIILMDYSTRAQNKESFQESINAVFTNKNVCFNPDVEKIFLREDSRCANSLVEFEEKNITKSHLQLKGKEYYRYFENGHTFSGPVKIFINHKPLKKKNKLSNFSINMFTYNQKEETYANLTAGSTPLIHVSETQSYAISNSIFYTTDDTNNAFVFSFSDETYNNSNGIEVEDITFVLPILQSSP